MGSVWLKAWPGMGVMTPILSQSFSLRRKREPSSV